jgi:hypothetical protein
MPSDLVLKSMNTIHRTMLKLSFGHIGWDAGGMPVLELTTTRPQERPAACGDAHLTRAAGRHDRHRRLSRRRRRAPRLVPQPASQPRRGGEVEGCRGEALHRSQPPPPEERAELWGTVTSKYKNYAGYQTKTEREIPLVLLTPVA